MSRFVSMKARGPRKRRSTLKIVESQTTSEDYDAVKPRIYTQTEKSHKSRQRTLYSFYDIVTQSDRFKAERLTNAVLEDLLGSKIFLFFMIAISFLNTICSALRMESFLDVRYGALFTAIETVINNVLVLEILVKWYYDFFSFWKDLWNLYNFTAVGLIIFSPYLSFIHGSLLLKIVRVSRALLCFRNITWFKGTQTVLKAILLSIPDMVNILMLMIIIVFVFAVLGLSLFRESCPLYFGSLGNAMFSMFICITQDGWVKIKQDLQACGNEVAGSIFLISFITIATFILSNIIIAVVVANLEWVIHDEKLRKQRQEKLAKADSDSDKVTTFQQHPLVFRELAQQQTALTIPQLDLSNDKLEKLSFVVEAMKDNLTEFTELSEKISRIIQEVKMLADVEEEVVSSCSDLARKRLSVTQQQTTSSSDDVEEPIVYGDVMSTLLTMSSHKELSEATNLDTLIRTIPSVRGPRTHSPGHLQPGDKELSASLSGALDHPYPMRKRTYTEPSAPFRQASKPAWKFHTPPHLALHHLSSKLPAPDSKRDSYFPVQPRVRLYTAPSFSERQHRPVLEKPVSPTMTDSEPKRDRKQSSFKRSFRRRHEGSSLKESSPKPSSALCLLESQADSSRLHVASSHHSAVPMGAVEEDPSPAPPLATPIIVLHASSFDQDVTAPHERVTPRSASDHSQ